MDEINEPETSGSSSSGSRESRSTGLNTNNSIKKNDSNQKDVLEDYDIIMEGDNSLCSSAMSDVNSTSTATVKSSSSTAANVQLIKATKSLNDADFLPSDKKTNMQYKKEIVGIAGDNTVVTTCDVSDFVDINIVKNNGSAKGKEGPAPVICPRVNCPEKIIICLDLNEEMDTTTFRSRAGDKYSGLELAKRAIKMFVLHKSQMTTGHEFAFLVFHEDATMIQSFTRNAQEILRTLDESEMDSQQSGPLNLSHFFETIKENVDLPIVPGNPEVIPPPYIVRVLLVFGRSHCVPVARKSQAQRDLESSPHFFTDVLYIHEPPSEDNKCEDIFQVLCELDHNGLSYIFEQSKYTPILNSGAKLLAHPLQRPQQPQAYYKIGTGSTVSQVMKED